MTELLDSVVSLIDGAWNVLNTDNLKPDIRKIVLAPTRLDLQLQDEILAYSVDYLTSSSGLGASHKTTTDHISIDLRVAGSDALTQGRNHAVRVRDELERILDANLLKPFSGYDLMVTTAVHDFSDKSRGLHRWVFDVKIERLSTARGTTESLLAPSIGGELGTLVTINKPTG